MAFVPIPGDLTNVKTKLMFGLTTRQVINFTLAGIIGVPVFMATNKYIGNELSMLLVMILASPFMYFSFFEKDGLTGEQFLKKMIDFNFKNNQVRTYKNMNFYETINDIQVLERHFYTNSDIEETTKAKQTSKKKKFKRKEG